MEKIIRGMRKSRGIIAVGVLAIGIISGTSIHYNKEIDKLDKTTITLKREKSDIVDVNKNLKLNVDKLEINVEKLNLENEKLNKENSKLKVEIKELKELKKLKKKSSKHYTMVVQATSYIPFCSEGCTGRTRTGYDVSNTIYYNGYRIIAVDIRLIPLYSIVEIEYNGTSFKAIAIDSGGAIRGRKIDVLTSTKEKAIEFGKKEVKLTVLRNGKGK